MKTYTVLEYVPQGQHHKCKDENGNLLRVDLMVNGDFPQGTQPEDLVGHTYTAEFEMPWEVIAMRVNPNPIDTEPSAQKPMQNLEAGK